MTVASSTDRATFPGNGTTTVFSLPFRFFANSEIQAWLVTNATGALSALTLGTHYTLVGAGDPEVDGNPTSVLTMITAPTSVQSLFVLRTIPLTQPTDIVNQGRFFPEIHENVFDRLMMLIQQAIFGSLRQNSEGISWDAKGKKIINLGTPASDTDASTKLYVDQQISSEAASRAAADTAEAAARSSADANLQAQISQSAPPLASPFSVISWHDQNVANSITIPANKNAWSFGPVITISPGQVVTIGSGSFWTIANGEVQ